MTDRECILHLQAIRMFCSAQQVAAVDRAVALLQDKVKQDEKAPLP